MSLRVELKPHERIVIGRSVITNADARTSLLIDGDAPILREKDILTFETADSPAKKIYLCVQMMYLENDIPKYQELYFGFIKDMLADAPHASSAIKETIESASNHILSDALYKALKEIRQLIKLEKALLLESVNV